MEQEHASYAYNYIKGIIVADLACLQMPTYLAAFQYIIGNYSSDIWFLPLPLL